MQHSPTRIPLDLDAGAPIPTIPGNPFAPFEVEHHQVAEVSGFLGGFISQLRHNTLPAQYSMYDLMQGSDEGVAVAVVTQRKVGLLMDLGDGRSPNDTDITAQSRHAVEVALRNFLPCVRPLYTGQLDAVLHSMKDINLYFGLGTEAPNGRAETVAAHVAGCFRKIYGEYLRGFDFLIFKDKPFPKARAFKPRHIAIDKGSYPFAWIQVSSMHNWLFLDDFVNSLAIQPVQEAKRRAPIPRFDSKSGKPIPRTKKGRAGQEREDKIFESSIPLPGIPKK